jgi:hypothetical protein
MVEIPTPQATSRMPPMLRPGLLKAARKLPTLALPTHRPR